MDAAIALKSAQRLAFLERRGGEVSRCHRLIGSQFSFQFPFPILQER
ncbi:hypothetical protein ACTJLB_30410 [Paraburkholderia sp. 22098]